MSPVILDLRQNETEGDDHLSGNPFERYYYQGHQNGRHEQDCQLVFPGYQEHEHKTGKRQEGLAYAGYGLFSKIASALTKWLAPVLVYTWSGYQFSQSANVAYAHQEDSTLSRFLAIYTIIPAVFVILQFVPILFYDIVGEKTERITAALLEKRAAEGLDEEPEEETLAEEVAKAVEAQAVEATEDGEQIAE